MFQAGNAERFHEVGPTHSEPIVNEMLKAAGSVVGQDRRPLCKLLPYPILGLGTVPLAA